MTKATRNRSRITADSDATFVTVNAVTGLDHEGPVEENNSYGYDSMTDTVVDNFFERINNGEIINNPCRLEVYKRFPNGAGYSRVQNLPSYDLISTGPVSYHYGKAPHGGNQTISKGPIVQPDSQYLLAGAKLRAIANLDATPYAFGEDVLEIRETVRFLRNPVKGLLDLSKSFKEARGRGKSLASLWLQYRFAVSPLIRSVTDALEAYTETGTTRTTRASARGYGFDVTSDEDEQYPVDINKRFKRWYQYDTNFKASILYEVTNPIDDWKYRLGFRVKDIPTTIWQVMPYSFMVDRLVDVTRFSQGVINLSDPSVKILSACVTEKTTETFKYQYVDTVASGWTTSGSGEVQNEVNFVYERTPWAPTYWDTVPPVNKTGLVDSATNILDLVTLILQRFK